MSSVPANPAADVDGRRPLAVTMGEPAGIGGEIAIQAWLRRDAERLPPFFLIDDPARLADVARELGADIRIAEIVEPRAAEGRFHTALPVLPLTLARPARPGELDPANAPAVVAAITRAVELVGQGGAAAVVTNPIHKRVLYDAGFAHPGHTEFLAVLAARVWGCAPPRPVMMLASPLLRVVPVTVHLPLVEAARSLRAEDIEAVGSIVIEALRCDFAVDEPRLAVAGLNPHAGEEGTLGREDIEIVAPAVARLQAAGGPRGARVFGPLAADSLFHAAARASYDAALCMYHDQALIPVKTLDFDRAVNVTLGLPFVRTSPDHGCALDIAGRGRARPDSLIAALRLAARTAANRAAGAVQPA